MPTYTTTAIQTIPFPYTALGQKLIIIAECDNAVAAEQNVKFVCKAWIDGEVIGYFKTTPNNAGVGVFEMSNIYSNYASPVNLSKGANVAFKLNYAFDVFPIHLIDKYSLSTNAVVGCTAHFYTEYTDATTGAIVQTALTLGCNFRGFNGYAKDTDVLYEGVTPAGGIPAVYGFGINTDNFILRENFIGDFISNSPTIQWCRAEDYMTMAFFPKGASLNDSSSNEVDHMYIQMYSEYDGVDYFANYSLNRTYDNGAYDGASSVTFSSGINMTTAANEERMLFVGTGPPQIRVYSGVFNGSLIAGTIKSYTLTLRNASDEDLTNTKIINISCPNLKNYEPIRLTWLNQWGTWDYFTFNQKSVKAIATKGTTYQQLGGTWNSENYKPYGYKGGKKSFRVNATETIKMNTDYLTEEHSEWFEELINSPEIYILKDWESPRSYSSPSGSGMIAGLTDYATPCTLKTKSFTKKTVANDKLIQYTFEVEKARTLRTQSI